MADTVDMTDGSNAQSLGGGVVRITNSVDLQAAQVKNTAAGGGDFATDDVIQCLDIPANMYVHNVFTKIKTASSATTLTATVGDGADPNGWDASVDLEGTAGTVACGVGGTDAFVASKKLYSTADTIDLVLTVDTVASLGEVILIAECFDPTYE